MGKKKYIAVVIFLLVVAAIIVISRNKNTLGGDLSVNAKQISQWEEVSIKKGESVLLLNIQGQNWTIANKVSASKMKVDLLKDILSNMAVKYPVTGPKGEELKKEIQANGICVSAKVAKKEVYRVYLQSQPEEEISYVYQPGHKYVLCVYEPGTSRNIADFFTVDYNYWRDNTFIALANDDILKLNCVWLSDSTQSFSISRLEGDIFDFTRNGQKVKFDSDMVKFYLYEFKNVSYEKRLSKENGMAGAKLCELDITSRQKTEYHISFYQKIEEGEVSSHELLVFLPEVKEWGVVTYLKANPILQKASFFERK